MELLNYHHLFFFWIIMNTGSIKAASVRLKLAQSTISTQLSAFEKTLGGKLFNRVGRNLEPTDLGHMVFGYADKIFTLGQEMMNSVHSLPAETPLSLRVGIVEVVPHLLIRKFLLPAMELSENIHLVCQQGKQDSLLSELAVHNLDVVFTDAPIRSGLSVKAYSHLLIECGITFLGHDKFLPSLKEKFPYSLDKCPMLLPMGNTALRGRLDQWFARLNILPHIIGEFDDSTLLKMFGHAGDGVFVAPQVIEEEIQQQYDVKIIGRSNEIIERFYAISIERIIKHPAIAAITKATRHGLFFLEPQFKK
ncbi:transcriptional activator NhaR [Desulfobacula sp.]|uniref:transcriptional activator NhaR n=1 Tax=Desulfobacula sp. TaxID=2593537 RepID=UPI00261F21DB|nr:transcriptional activator NhaR [Desulfobacula sp.]